MNDEQLFNRIIDAIEELQIEFTVSIQNAPSGSRANSLLDQSIGVSKTKLYLLNLKNKLIDSEDDES